MDKNTAPTENKNMNSPGDKDPNLSEDEKRIEMYKNMLNETDFQSMMKSREIRKLFKEKSPVLSVGCRFDPWINTVTLYNEHPNVIEVSMKILEIDPNVEIDYKSGRGWEVIGEKFKAHFETSVFAPSDR
jgi:hypothetical protein